MTDIKFKLPSTALSRLNQRQNLKIDFDKEKVIIPSSDYYTLRIRESLEILRQGNNVCNDVLSHEIPHIWFNILKICTFQHRNERTS